MTYKEFGEGKKKKKKKRVYQLFFSRALPLGVIKGAYVSGELVGSQSTRAHVVCKRVTLTDSPRRKMPLPHNPSLASKKKMNADLTVFSILVHFVVLW